MVHRQYFCPVCGEDAGNWTVQCTACSEWVHTWKSSQKRDCADIGRVNLGRWVRPREWVCATCRLKAQRAVNAATTYGLRDHAAPAGARYLHILQLNCNGILGKVDELAAYFHAGGYHVICLQETKLAGDPPKFAGYASFHVNRAGQERGGGLLTLVMEHLVAIEVPMPMTGEVEQLVVRISLPDKSELTVANVYIPPEGPRVQRVSIQHLLNLGDRVVIVGDVNAHNPLWEEDCAATRARGNDLGDEIDASNFVVMNDPAVTTRRPFGGAFNVA